MGIFNWLFGSPKPIGPIYSAATVKAEYRRIAEAAMAEKRYDIESKNGPDNFVVRLHCQPPLRAMIRMDHSLAPPAMIIAAVYAA